MRKRYFILVEGRVQGVGFRYTMQMNAMNLQLSGYAKNLENGNVEIQVEGDEENLNKFIQLMLQGSRFIHVQDYSLKEIECIHDHSFRVLG